MIIPFISTKRTGIALLLGCALGFTSMPQAHAQDSFLKRLFGRAKSSETVTTNLSNSDVIEGLKEALRVGTENTVKLVGKENGYFDNEKIRIPLPEQVTKMENALRVVGFGPQLDEFELSMNRAAEKAAPEAKKVFLDSIKQMTFKDAQNILSSRDDTAATKYFKKTTTKPLTVKFTPIIENAMAEYTIVQQYSALVKRYRAIPFLSSQPVPDIEDYTVDKALDGLFYTLAEEEKKIRTNPAARVTDILKSVFGGSN